MMPVLLIILIPLAVLLIGAVVFDLRRRQRLGAFSSHDNSSAVHRARRDADVQLSRNLPGGGFSGDGGV
jgi:preprotein translocase subunit SecG